MKSIGIITDSHSGITQEEAKQLADEYDGSSTKEITKVSGKKATVPSYFVNVNKQTLPEAKDGSGGYEIASLNELELLYFIPEALDDTANAYESYRVSAPKS